MQGQITSGANCIAQRATITALEAPVSNIQYMIDEFKNRELIIALLTQIPGIKLNQPRSVLCFPDILLLWKKLRGKTIENASDFALYLFEEAHVATVTGDTFGITSIRISFFLS